MLYAGSAPEDAPGTRTGGVPLVPAGFEWPICKTCGGPMQFLAQIQLPDGYLSIFMCQNDPGMCEEWDPFAGGNKALLFGADGLTAATPPGTGVTKLPEVSAVKFEDHPDEDYDTARRSFGERTREVLGQLGGEPAWIQGEETPNCPVCGKPMRFVAQLEEGHQYETAANFGGGSAYAFACVADKQAAFLWQQ